VKYVSGCVLSFSDDTYTIDVDIPGGTTFKVRNIPCEALSVYFSESMPSNQLKACWKHICNEGKNVKSNAPQTNNATMVRYLKCVFMFV
jgi:hypothetical protein